MMQCRMNPRTRNRMISTNNILLLPLTKATKSIEPSINGTPSNKNIQKKKKNNSSNNKTTRLEHFALLLIVAFLSLTHISNLNIISQEVLGRDLSSVVSNIISEEGIASQPEGEVLLTTSVRIREQIWSDVKLAIYMTTHLSETHMSFLPCWNDAIRRMKIFQYADLILYTSSYPTPVMLQHLPFDNVTIKLYNNSGYQSGAIQAMIDPFVDETDQWFDNYDWVIRLNPDVLIRNDTWLIQTMLNTSIDAIVHDCRNRKLYPTNSSGKVIRPKFHTDFTAFRPQAIDRNLFLFQNDKAVNAEKHITNALRNIYMSSRFAYVEGGQNSKPGRCRIGGRQSPIVHVHELSKFCPYYYNATNSPKDVEYY